MLALLRKMLKPAALWLRDQNYRQTLRLHASLRNVPAGLQQHIHAAGFEIEIHDASSFLNQWDEIFVHEIYAFQAATTKPVIVDCGANMGLGVLYFKKRFPQATVIAFEADQAIAQVVQKNVQQNKLTNVTVYAAAAWTAAGTISFDADGAQGGQAGQGTIQIPAMRLRDELLKYERIDFLKMDIEGAEHAVLHDCQDALERVDHLFVEYHSRTDQPQQLHELLRLLTQHQFRYTLRGGITQSPLLDTTVENGFDMMIDIFAKRITK
jgi:FkbM family methyltransferase